MQNKNNWSRYVSNMGPLVLFNLGVYPIFYDKRDSLYAQYLRAPNFLEVLHYLFPTNLHVCD